MHRNLKLTLAYDGAGFHGWQTQPGLRTVQETVERLAERVLRHPVHLFGASRTDAGVHALGQVAHLPTDCLLDATRIRRALGDRMPDDVALVDLFDVSPGFHATRWAQAKLYRYVIFAGPLGGVIDGRHARSWHVWWPLDPDRMQAAGRAMTGRHDFAGFASSGSPRATTVRSVHRVDVSQRGREIRIDVVGDGFLYNQVRNMVGTLVEIGRGHWPVERVAQVLAARDRALAGPTAPPQGLTLCWVRYPPNVAQPFPAVSEHDAQPPSAVTDDVTPAPGGGSDRAAQASVDTKSSGRADPPASRSA